MVDYRKFKMNSNFKMDNVVFVKEQTLSGSSGSFSANILHGLSFVPLAFGLYSADNGTTWSQINFQTQFSSGSLYATSSNIVISLYLNSRPATVKVRLFAFAPSNVNDSVSAPTPLSNFYLNSNFGYDVLIKSDRVSVPNSSSAQVVFQHNLGHVPRVMVWEENGSDILQFTSSSITDYAGLQSNAYVEVTSSQLKIMNYSNQGGYTRIFHYRLYGSENV